MPNLLVAEPIDELLDAPTVAEFKALLALNAVDNTSDASKPVSAAQQTALNTKQAAGTYVTPATLNGSTLPVAATTLSATGAVTLSGPATIGGHVLLKTTAGAELSLRNFSDSDYAWLHSYGGVIYSGGLPKIDFNYVAGGISFANDILLGWGSTSGISTRDVIILRDGPNILAQRNNTDPQAFRLYETWANTGTDYSRLTLNYAGSFFQIVAENGGTGTKRGVYITGASLAFGTDDGTVRWRFSSIGHILAEADNTYDIGASGATRPRNVYVANSVVCNEIQASSHVRTGASTFFFWNGRSYMSSPADGNVLLQDSANNSFSRLQLGGTTSSFPALKRSAAQLHCRLADDSDDAAFQALQLNVAGTKVLGAQGEAVADVAVGSVPQTGAGATDCMDAINLILARLRDHGIIAT